MVLHCASPSVHNIATSEVAVIFTGRLKRGNKGPFVVKMFLTLLITLPSAMVFVLKFAQFPHAK